MGGGVKEWGGIKRDGGWGWWDWINKVFGEGI